MCTGVFSVSLTFENLFLQLKEEAEREAGLHRINGWLVFYFLLTQMIITHYETLSTINISAGLFNVS